MIALLQTTSGYWDDVCREWKQVRRELDEDSVHDLRVASRRAAASIFLLESVLQRHHPLKARRRIKRLMKKLGPLRDVQVQISMVRNWKPNRVIEEFLSCLCRSEKEEGRAVRKYLSADRKKRIRRSLKALEDKTTLQLKSTADETIRHRIEATLRAQRADLEAARAGMVSSDPQSLHALRVAAKTLRYSLEAASAVVGDPPSAELQQLHRYQTRLGHIRDVQILKERFQQWQSRRSAEAA